MNETLPFLATVIENGVVVEQTPSGDWIFTAICLVLGLFHIFCPYATWYITHGWKFRDAEPSDFVLAMTRVGGGVFIAVGIIYLFI